MCLLKEKIRVALIYKSNYKFLTGNHFDNTTYYFFMHALKRNKNLDVTYHQSENYFDCAKLKNKADIILLPMNNTDGTPDVLDNIHELDIPVISRTGDPHWANRYNQFQFHEKWNIDYYFNFMHESYFHKFYPKNYNYKKITFGLEPNLYREINHRYDNRIKNKILNSGAIGKTNLKSRLANKILNPKRSGWYFYKLRTKCNNLDYIIHTKNIPKTNTDYTYAQILSQYFASIAATTFYPTIKYWEVPASGCLTFMEITELNRGTYLGFKDGENAIFINEKNYEKKFLDYLNDPHNTKWIEIAKAGKIFADKNFNNDHATEDLVSLMIEILKK